MLLFIHIHIFIYMPAGQTEHNIFVRKKTLVSLVGEERCHFTVHQLQLTNVRVNTCVYVYM